MTKTAATSDDAPLVSVVVPTYQERDNLDELVGRVSETLDRLEMLFEIIVVDDDSRDGTDAEIARLQQAGRPVRLVERRGERGLSSAVLRGFDEARGEYLVCMDADLSHPPEALPELLSAIRATEAEMVIGSRYVPGASTDEEWGKLRRLNSRVATLLARPFTSLKDPMAGFFALPRAVFQRTREWDPVGYKIGLEILVKARCQEVREVPIHFENRRRGQSKLSLREQLNYLRHLGRLARFKFELSCQLATFAIVGATGAAVDLATLGALLYAGVALPAARALAIAAALTWNFSGNERFTFRCGEGGEGGGRIRRFARFALVCSAGAAINYGVSLLAPTVIPALAGRPLPAAVLGILLAAGANFFGARRWVFPALNRGARAPLPRRG